MNYPVFRGDVKQAVQEESVGNKIERVSLQWNKLSDDIPYIFSIVLQHAIEHKNRHTFRQAVGEIGLHFHTILSSSLGNFQKAWLLRPWCGTLHVYQTQAVAANLISKSHDIVMIDSFVADRAIDYDLTCASEILESSSEFVLELLKYDVVDEEILNLYGSVGRYCSANYPVNENYRKSLDYIISVLTHLKRVFEEDLTKRSELYLKLKTSFESFITYHSDPIGIRKPSAPVPHVANESLLESLRIIIEGFKPVQVQTILFRIPWNPKDPERH